MSEKVAVVGIEVKHGESEVTGMIENDQWFDIGDEHITTNVEFLSVDQQGIGNVTMFSRRCFSVIVVERRKNKPLNDSFHWFHGHLFLSL